MWGPKGGGAPVSDHFTLRRWWRGARVGYAVFSHFGLEVNCRLQGQECACAPAQVVTREGVWMGVWCGVVCATEDCRVWRGDEAVADEARQ